MLPVMDEQTNSASITDQKIAAIAAFLEEQKARDVAIHRFSNPNAIADAFIIATATSRRHAQGLADGAALAGKAVDKFSPHMEGYDNAQWILVDAGDVITHIFQEDVRDLYRLDDLCRHESHEEKFNDTYPFAYTRWLGNPAQR